MRLVIDCIESPMAVLFAPRLFVISEALAGNAIAFHAEKKMSPIKTAIQLVNTIAITYPAIAIKLNNRNDFLFPILSAIYPPGNDQKEARKFCINPQPEIIRILLPKPSRYLGI